MKKTGRTEFGYMLYIIISVVLAGVYFLAPERREFLDYQRMWWSQMWEVIKNVL